MSDYKLCKQAGLDIQGPGYIDAYQVESLLASAPGVRGRLEDGRWVVSAKWIGETDTHTARILLIEEIVKEPEEIRLLRELVSDWEKYVTNGHMNKEIENRQQIHMRAREFLKRRDSK